MAKKKARAPKKTVAAKRAKFSPKKKLKKKRPGKKVRRVDRCKPIRDELAEVNADIRSIEESLTDPDILERIKVGLRAELARLKARRTRLERALVACEAV